MARPSIFKWPYLKYLLKYEIRNNALVAEKDITSYRYMEDNNLILTDKIRNYQVRGALPTKYHKTSREYFVLAELKYAFPEKFSKLKKGEAPDLQDIEGSLGVEVTWGGSPTDELISGESFKYSQAKTDKEREKCLQKI